VVGTLTTEQATQPTVSHSSTSLRTDAAFTARTLRSLTEGKKRPLLPHYVTWESCFRWSKADELDGHGRDVTCVEGFGLADGAKRPVVQILDDRGGRGNDLMICATRASALVRSSTKPTSPMLEKKNSRAPSYRSRHSLKSSHIC